MIIGNFFFFFIYFLKRNSLNGKYKEILDNIHAPFSLMIDKFNEKVNKNPLKNFELQKELYDGFGTKTIFINPLEEKKEKLLGKKIQKIHNKESNENTISINEKDKSHKEKTLENISNDNKNEIKFEKIQQKNEENFDNDLMENFLDDKSLSEDLSSSEESSINFN